MHILTFFLVQVFDGLHPAIKNNRWVDPSHPAEIVQNPHFERDQGASKFYLPILFYKCILKFFLFFSGFGMTGSIAEHQIKFVVNSPGVEAYYGTTWPTWSQLSDMQF